jgi:nucleotide-binding universal stress UspA family protein
MAHLNSETWPKPLAIHPKFQYDKYTHRWGNCCIVVRLDQEVVMFNHILVPVDGSALAECVLPHVQAVATATNARVMLLHALEYPQEGGNIHAIDPLEWHLKKKEAASYLERITDQLRNAGLTVESIILEGAPAECVIDFATSHDIDLIVLSTHGRSGLSGWNMSSVVQKIVQRSYKSTLLVRAYKPASQEFTSSHYRRLFVGLDCSARAEYVLPLAISLAEFFGAQLVLGTIIQRPRMLQRFPLSESDTEMVNGVIAKNEQAASHYFDQLHSQLALEKVDLQTRLVVSDHPISALHDLVEQEQADLVLLVAHGHGGEGRWPYGSVASSFIHHGTTALLIMQDLAGDEVKRSQAELAARETKGH